MIKKTIIIICTILILSSCNWYNDKDKPNKESWPVHDNRENEPNTAKEEVAKVYSSWNFIVNSTEVSQWEYLPVTYTCDGESSMLPISWSNAPENTGCYAVIMSHLSPDLDTHSYMVRYNIPSNTNNLLSDSEDIWSWWINTVNRQPEYAPPCSKWPWDKTYTYTVYALSTCDNIIWDNLSREQVINSMTDDVLDSATLDVIYSR